jgi:TRAP-type C4-dicarboxylate transport system permease small subunit
MLLTARLLLFLRVLAMLALGAMALVTIVDVTLRNTINELVLGGVEIVQLTLVAVVFFALPETLLRGEHITIDVIDQAVPAPAVRALRVLGGLATLLLLVVMAWRMLLPALDTLEFGDMTTDLRISLFWYWLPLLIGGAAAVLAQLVVVVRTLAARDGPGNDAAQQARGGSDARLDAAVKSKVS